MMSKAGATAVIFVSTCGVAAAFALSGGWLGQSMGLLVFFVGAALVLAR